MARRRALIDKTAEQYHIKSIDQLKDPKIAKLFDTNGDGKADLTGCTPGWGCEAVINHQIDAYGLSKTVTQPGQLCGDDGRHHCPL
jgi:glycine betaine/proline transport system substrate-binding protein